ncbi:Synaptonemal complex protein 1 [Acorus gramineus]|uniref:Synaptonemal complex protein 1 n=1 Tax=Acorus gramineus TaxID=55184 RepID=A0AAV9AGN9_ACOGR|nr:Synaptonemal complex protein 1 [Acorus gramineus]
MNKLGFSGLKSLDQLRSNTGSFAKSNPTMNSRMSVDSLSYGSFTTLKLTAEKLIKEQASVKTDLEMALSKLKRSAEQIHVLEKKLQNLSIENEKLRVKQKEDEKHWKCLDSKLSSTKTMCEQLTETLQQLVGRVQESEEDKKSLEDKLSKSSTVFDDLYHQMNQLSLELDSAQKNVEDGKQELKHLRHEKVEVERTLMNERCATENLLSEKDAAIKHLDTNLAADKESLKSLDSQLQQAQYQLNLKEEICKCLRVTQENMEKEKAALQSSNEDFERQLLIVNQDLTSLKDIVHGLVACIVELDKQSIAVSNKFIDLISAYEIYCKLVNQEKDCMANRAKCHFDKLHDRFLHFTSENDTFRLEIEDLKNKLVENQKVQEFVMVQHAEECRLAEEKIQKLESEAETVVSKKNELEILVTKLEDKNNKLSESAILTHNEMKDQLLKISNLESESQAVQDKMKSELQNKSDEIEMLQNEITKRDQCVSMLENEVTDLRSVLNEKEQIQASLAAAECKISEATKQFDLIMEGKQLELTKHLKEISQKNDQAINDIRRKYELEKLEIVNVEKEKADKLIKEAERRCEEKVTANKEEAQQYIMQVQEEHAALVSRIQQEHDKKEMSLRIQHGQELQRVQLQAENELKEKTMLLKKEHEIQLRNLSLEHDDECTRLQEELELQKSREEKQRALLQLQWKVMGEKQQDDPEVNSKREHSISSTKLRDADGGKGNRLALSKPENGKDAKFREVMSTPVTSLLKKVEKGNPGSVLSIPKHSKKVTRHEYEVETSNGRTITKRSRTKSTVLFGEPATHKRANRRTPKATPKAGRDVTRVIKVPQSTPRNIGDLFSEGSLNPYADDPYAFD